MSIALGITAIVLLAVAAGTFALCESVVVHIGQARASTLAEQGAARGDTLRWVLERREESLATLAVLRIVAQVGVVGLVVARAQERGIGGRSWLVVAAALVLGLGGVEVVARTAALVRSDAAALRLAPLIWLVVRVPVVSRFAALPGRLLRRRANGTLDVDDQPPVSEGELLALAEVAAEAEVIELEERALIKSIIEFGDTIVREVMVPRPDMVTVESTFRVADAMEVVILNGFSRIPVTGEGIDDVVGIVYAKDLMRAERDGREREPVAAHLRQPRFVPEQKRVAELLPEMQAQQFHMAIVIDEYGGVAGLVTLEDLIEELVGEIVDEFDVEDPMVEPLPGGGYRVNARTPLDEVNELLGADLPTGDWDTIGGLVFGLLGKVPASGERVACGGFELTASKVQGRRIGIVRIDRLPPEPVAADADA